MELSDPATLPPLYARWLAEALGGPIPGEPRAVCDPCVMCNSPPGPVEPFHPVAAQKLGQAGVVAVCTCICG